MSDAENSVSIETIPELRRAIRRCEEVMIQPRFGCMERWVKISKKEALAMFEHLDRDETPEGMQMWSGIFGELIEGVLYLG